MSSEKPSIIFNLLHKHDTLIANAILMIIGEFSVTNKHMHNW